MMFCTSNRLDGAIMGTSGNSSAVEYEKKDSMGKLMATDKFIIEDNGEITVFGTISSRELENYITNINILVPNKVVEITFGDGSKEKMVLKEPDVFDLRRCCFIALAKKLYRKEYTYEGIEYMATQLSMQKKFVKIVDKALKTHQKLIEQSEKELAEERLLQERLARKKAKKQAKKKERLEQEDKQWREEMIEIQKEAYKRAFQECSSENSIDDEQ